ncbi:peptidase inhibitor family I36 protein [Streptomyces sp. TRM 70351]|uniref:peptidase inhibitor family I36 protein n=1 Tax=Streptomyces sp. TRM 70351 TaxID=3116552 RepID=UPI002E7ADF58|nr:peptidase inhibitor family I36 protein [Streptomyces sp. TRM 70351]MEE1930122.1 peptidase inhibitor family I36 protein [Streptomyces sp. TRM 70351]
MKRSGKLSAAFAAAGASVVLVVGTATPAAWSAPTAAAPCAQGNYCWWSGTDFGGRAVAYNGDLEWGACYTTAHVGSVRSYAHYHRQEGYFHANGDCTGRSRAVLGFTENRNIGFDARSFRAACVSCRAER